MKKKKEINIILASIKEAESTQTEYKTRSERMQGYYNNDRDEDHKKYSGANDVYDPRAFQEIENLLARTEDTLLSNPRPATVIAREKGLSEKARKIQNIADSIFKRSRFRARLEMFLSALFIKGNMAATVSPDGTFGYEEFENLIIDPDATEPDNIGWICRKIQVSYRDIADNPVYEPGADFERYAKEKISSAIDEHKKQFTMYEYWDKGTVLSVIDSAYVVRNAKNEFGRIPVFVQNLYRTGNDTVYGKGILEIAEDIINLNIDNLNLMLDNKDMVSRPVGFTSDRSLPDQFEIVAGKIFQVSSKDDIPEFMKVPDMSNAAVFTNNLVNQKLKEVTGNFDIAVGGSLQRQEYATVVNIMTQNANLRINRVLMKIGDFFMSVADLCLQMADADMTGLDLLWNGGGVGEITRKMRIDDFTKIAMTLMNLDPERKYIDIRSIIEYIAKESGHDPDLFLLSTREKKQLEVAAQAAAQQNPSAGAESMPGNPMAALIGAMGAQKSRAATDLASQAEAGAAAHGGEQ